jgi:hypothetical protein
MLHADVDAPRVAAHAPLPAAAFTARSYAPGDRARLVVRHADGKALVQILEIGGDPLVRGAGGLYAKLVRPAAPLRPTVVVGTWPSGVYAARVCDRGHVTYAVFVLRDAKPKEPRVAVVVPTNTWAAYNFTDGNGDGVPDTWYRSQAATSMCMNARGAARGCTVSLSTPMDMNGLGRHFRSSVVGFLRWMSATGRVADVLSEDDLERISSGDLLASRYALIVYPWHSEYVTSKEYALIQRYRDLGGRLAFLSADNFYRRVDRHGDDLTLVDTWRDLGRSEAALVGEEYIDWFHDLYPNRPYLVTGVASAPWLFAGTGLHDGSRFGVYGIEIDATTSESPPGVRVLARIPDIFGNETADMTYYTTSNGARVFAAGTMNFGASAMWPRTRILLDNLWTTLTTP